MPSTVDTSSSATGHREPVQQFAQLFAVPDLLGDHRRTPGRRSNSLTIRKRGGAPVILVARPHRGLHRRSTRATRVAAEVKVTPAVHRDRQCLGGSNARRPRPAEVRGQFGQPGQEVRIARFSVA